MAFWKSFKEIMGTKPKSQQEDFCTCVLPREKETQSVIQDLSRVVMNNPDAVDIYLALGSLYRVKGDVERAVQIRESLLIRSELAPAFKARTFFELGQDYRRAGLMDRALNAYMEAEKLGYPSLQIKAELASFYADSGDYEQAASHYALIGNKAAVAHYLVKIANEAIQQADPKKSSKYLEKAIKTYPASPEAWAAIIRQYVQAGKFSNAAKYLAKALENIPEAQTFMVFEELMTLQPPVDNPDRKFEHNLTSAFMPVLEKYQQQLAVDYFAATLLLRCKKIDEAGKWLNRALIIQPEFWSGRLTQLELSKAQYTLPPQLDADLEFFLSQSGKIKRFICASCGLNSDQLFYSCPRCHSWHSAKYKNSITD